MADTDISAILHDNFNTTNTDAPPAVLRPQNDATTNLLGDTAGSVDRIAVGIDATVTGIDSGSTVDVNGLSLTHSLQRDGTTVEILDANGNLAASVATSSEEVTKLNFLDGQLRLQAQPDAGIITANGTAIGTDPTAASTLPIDAAGTSQPSFISPNSTDIANGQRNATHVIHDGAPNVVEVNAGLDTRILGESKDQTIKISEGASASGIDAGATVKFDRGIDAFTFIRNGTTVEVVEDDGDVAAQVAAGDEAGELVFANQSVSVKAGTEGVVVGDVTIANDGGSANPAEVLTPTTAQAGIQAGDLAESVGDVPKENGTAPPDGGTPGDTVDIFHGA